MPESGVPEQAFVKKYYRRSFALTRTPPLNVFARPQFFALCPQSEHQKQAQAVQNNMTKETRHDDTDRHEVLIKPGKHMT